MGASTKELNEQFDAFQLKSSFFSALRLSIEEIIYVHLEFKVYEFLRLMGEFLEIKKSYLEFVV